MIPARRRSCPAKRAAGRTPATPSSSARSQRFSTPCPQTRRTPNTSTPRSKATCSARTPTAARRRTFRYLKELYLLRPDSLLFRALRDLWPDDPEARPLLAGLCALARDPVFRASSTAIIRSVARRHAHLRRSGRRRSASTSPASYSESTLAKIGRNTFSSWEQTGHLAAGERATKVRTRATCRPAERRVRAAARPPRGRSRAGPVRDAVGAGARPAHVAPGRPRRRRPRSAGCSSSATPAA